jgi:hypothetical protein
MIKKMKKKKGRPALRWYSWIELVLHPLMDHILHLIQWIKLDGKNACIIALQVSKIPI